MPRRPVCTRGRLNPLRDRLPRIATFLMMALFVFVASAPHSDPLQGRSEIRLEAHHHGPFAPCPNTADAHCLACAAASSPGAFPATVATVEPPQPSRDEWKCAKRIASYGQIVPQSGRSPPTVAS